LLKNWKYFFNKYPLYLYFYRSHFGSSQNLRFCTITLRPTLQLSSRRKHGQCTECPCPFVPHMQSYPLAECCRISLHHRFLWCLLRTIIPILHLTLPPRCLHRVYRTHGKTATLGWWASTPASTTCGTPAGWWGSTPGCWGTTHTARTTCGTPAGRWGSTPATGLTATSRVVGGVDAALLPWIRLAREPTTVDLLPFFLSRHHTHWCREQWLVVGFRKTPTTPWRTRGHSLVI
jgi:hypothetical protein